MIATSQACLRFHASIVRWKRSPSSTLRFDSGFLLDSTKISCRHSPSIFLTPVLFELRTYCLIPQSGSDPSAFLATSALKLSGSLSAQVRALQAAHGCFAYRSTTLLFLVPPSAKFATRNSLYCTPAGRLVSVSFAGGLCRTTSVFPQPRSLRVIPLTLF